MGMIMKDGIPYGGIYPIDDAPTQGSNNAVKSGSVFSSLSNKVDKVAGKGLSTNDYDNTEKEQNAANAEAIEAMVNANGCCNVFAIDNPISLVNVRVANYGIVNTDIDTKTVFTCWIGTFNSSGQQIQAIGYQNIDSTGHKVLDITIPDNNYYSLQLRHNGSVRDLAIHVPAVPAGDYKMSFDVVGYNPSTVGGLAIRNIMLYDARLNPTEYVSYSMTNSELTEICSDIPNNLFKYYSATAIDDFETLPLGVVAINTNSSTLHHPPTSANAFVVFTTGGWDTYHFRMQLAMSYWTNEIFMRIAWGGVSYDVWKKITTS